jgi:hypothetical protein
MNATTKTNGIPQDVLADMQVVADAVAGGWPVDAEVAKRVRARSENVQRQLLQQHGVREIAVDLIRQGRKE